MSARAGLGFGLGPAALDISSQLQWPHSPAGQSVNLGSPRELCPESLGAKNEERDFALVSNQKFPRLDELKKVFPWTDAHTEKNGQSWDLWWSVS